MILIIAALVILPVLYITGRWFFKKSDSTLPPGPSFSLFYILSGRLLELLHPSRVHLTLEKWSKTYGPLMHFQVAGKHFVVFSSIKLTRKALDSDEYREFTNSRRTCFRGIHFMWNHDVILQGKYNAGYFNLRKCLYKGLTEYGHCVPQYEKNSQDNVQWLIRIIQNTKGEDIVLLPVIKETIANYISILLTGELTDRKSEQIQMFLDIVLQTVEPSFEVHMDKMYFLRYIPGTRFKQLCTKYLNVRDNTLDIFYEDTKKSFDPDKTRGLVDTLLNIQMTGRSGGELKLLDNQIKGIILDTISGALLTSTYGCLAAVINVMNYTHCIDEIRKEIDDVIGSDRLPRSEDLDEMDYTHAVMLETFRYSSHVPTLPMKCTTKDLEFEEYTIPAESGVLINVWSCHHDPDVWTDPWKFKPERFLDKDGHILPPTHDLRESVLTLGVGPRYCLGSSLGKSWIFLTLVTLIQQFDLLTPSDGILHSDDPYGFSGVGIIGPQKLTLRAVSRETSRK